MSEQPPPVRYDPSLGEDWPRPDLPDCGQPENEVPLLYQDGPWYAEVIKTGRWWYEIQLKDVGPPAMEESGTHLAIGSRTHADNKARRLLNRHKPSGYRRGELVDGGEATPAVTRLAHPAALTPAPACPGCGRPMQPGRGGVYGCDHTDTTRPAADLPRGDHRLAADHTPKPMTGPWHSPPDRGPHVLRSGIGDGVKKGQT